MPEGRYPVDRWEVLPNLRQNILFFAITVSDYIFLAKNQIIGKDIIVTILGNQVAS